MSRPLFALYIRDGARGAEDWRCGVEVELFGFEEADWQRIGPQYVDALVRGFAEQQDDVVIDNQIAVESKLASGGYITVEPGGQIEFSSAPRDSLVELECDLRAYISRLNMLAGDRDLRSWQ
jgi:gamma-glutamylcysteine synthetase